MRTTAVLALLLVTLLVSGTESGSKFLFGSTGGGMKVVPWHVAFEEYSGVDVTLVQFFGAFADAGYLGWQREIMNAAATKKYVPYIVLDPAPVWPAPAHPNVSKEVTAGVYDGFFDVYCAWLRDYLSGPDKVYGNGDDLRIHMRFAHEFNIQPYSFDPPSFILMWRYVWEYFTIKRGLDTNHVQWHWCMSGGQTTWDMDQNSHMIDEFYPGDAYVDWLSFDAYNWGTVNSWGKWIDTANATLQYNIDRLSVLNRNKPISIAETGSSTRGGSLAKKNAWLKGLFPYLYDTGRIQMLLMFNTDADGADWTYFGTGDANFIGDEEYVYRGDPSMPGNSTFKAFSGMKDAKQYVYSPNPSNPRIVTDAEFFGHLNQQPMCPGNPPCSSRGACDLLGKCTCVEGYTGTDCSKNITKTTCPDRTCGGRGACVDGACVCLSGFAGCGSGDIMVYRDSIGSGWSVNASAASLAVATPHYNNSGTSMSVDLNTVVELYFNASSKTFAKSTFGALEFYVYVNNLQLLKNVTFALTSGNKVTYSNNLLLADYAGGNVATNTWIKIRMPASAFAIQGDNALTGLLLKPKKSAATIYLDEIVVVYQVFPATPTLAPTPKPTNAPASTGATTAQATSGSQPTTGTVPSTTAKSSSSTGSQSTTSSPSATSSSPSATSSSPAATSSSAPASSTASPTSPPSTTSPVDESGAGVLRPAIVCLVALLLALIQ